MIPTSRKARISKTEGKKFKKRARAVKPGLLIIGDFMEENNILRELYLIRHGESFCNVEGYEAQGIAEKNDPLLTEKGKEQAERLGSFFKDTDTKFDAVYSSGLRRTVMTANEILRYQNGLKLNILPELCEIGIMPEYTGQSLEGLKELCGAAETAECVEDDTCLCVPDETPGQAEYRYFQRVQRVLEYIYGKYTGGEKVALVSHAGFLTYIIFYLIGFRDNQPSYDFRLTNTGVTKIIFYKPGTNRYGDMIFDCINERKHLPD